MNSTVMSNLADMPSEWFRIFLIILFIIIVFIGLIGNTLVLLSVSTHHIKIRRSSTNLLLVNMSCADLIILSFNMLDIIQFSYDHSWPTAWYLGLFLCKMCRYFQVLGCYVSVQTLLAISIERYISIIHPVKISHVNRRKRLLFVFILIWSIGIIMASPNLFLLTLHPHINRPEYYVCGLSDHLTYSYIILFYKYIESILFFYIPISIQTVLYIIICRNIFMVERAVQANYRSEQLQQSTASDSHRPFSGTKMSSLVQTPINENNNNNMSLMPMITPRIPTHITISNSTQKNGDTARKHAIIMLLLVAILYFIAFSPAQINFIYVQINHLHHLYENRLFFIISILLALSSTAFNPILFYIFSRFFRHKFNIILRSLCSICRVHSRRQNNYPMV